uniref:CCHC-type domain-containing protein n=1 Tax=Fagus sylvatica TaxID=28930 RepID=A0A2N9FHW8_FAGSY
MMSQLSTMKTLNDLNFESWMEWKTDLQIILGLLDLDLALYKDKPTKASEHERWKKSNRLSLLIMKSKTANSIRGLVHESSTGNAKAKQFFAALEDIFMKMERVRSDSLFEKVWTMKYDGEGSVCEHIMKMSSIFSRLRAMNMDCGLCFVKLAVRSLPHQFLPLKVDYYEDENWGLGELLSRAELEENNFSDKSFEWEQSGYTSVDNNRGKRAKIRCFSCGEIGHKRKDCNK